MSELPVQESFRLVEQGMVYPVKNHLTVGILHAGHELTSTGVLFVVGGRQYRVGAHRQFVLLARSLAKEGFPVFRFDLCGMGDSEGDPQHFLEMASDLDSALAAFRAYAPSVKRIVIWGLCDGATGATTALTSLTGVSGVMMVNPWVTTNSGAAKVRIKHYYRYRLVSSFFWGKLIKGKVDIKGSSKTLLDAIKLVILNSIRGRAPATGLPEIVFDAIEKFEGLVSIVISDKDLTALEFHDKYNDRYGNSSNKQPRFNIVRVDADHTFSGEGQHAMLDEMTLDFVRKCHVNECP